MPDPQLTVFLIDDDEDIRRALQRALEKRGYSVQSHASAASFLADFDPDRPGCLLLDYGMPGMNGLELQKHLNALGATIPVVFITGHGGVPESVQAIKAGAVDFLEKPFRQADLVERIETTFAIARERLDHDERDRCLRARFNLLTARELEIVERMIARPSEISSKELASALGISPRTVDHHRARILEKMSVRSVAELIALATR
jgi:two-component system response regulator FixJ